LSVEIRTGTFGFRFCATPAGSERRLDESTHLANKE
jgi:hypothetical protein